MELLLAISGRRSIREFLPDPISSKTLEEILNLACMAPSAGNRQPWKIQVIEDPAMKQLLASAAFGQSFINQAPVLLVIWADLERSAGRYGERGRALYALQDTAALITTLLLAAWERGIGSCWIGAFDESSVQEITGCTLRPVALIPLGKPAQNPPARPRRPLGEIIMGETEE